MGNERRRKWAVVAAAAAVLIAVPAVVTALPTSADRVEAGQLRQLIVASDGQPYQGYVESHGSLGLPDLPNLGDLTSLLNGRTRIRAWYASATQWRFAVLSVGGERDVYRTPAGEFVWDYGANLLTRVVGEPPVRLPRAGDLLPPELARRILRAAPNDPVSELPPRRVAGHTAAGLRLSPADPLTSIAAVDIWADPATGLPLQVAVTARGASQPVMVSNFVDVSLSRPPARVLVPNRPPGSGFTVASAPDVANALGTLGLVGLPPELAGRKLQTPGVRGIQHIGLYGTGLSTFVTLPLPRRVGSSAADAARNGGAATIELPNGNRALVLTIPPLSLLVVRSTVARWWYVLAGPVDPELLRRAAAEL